MSNYQVFYVSLGGFDNHQSDQRTPTRVRPGGPGLESPLRSSIALGVAENVTTFTLSDFGSTLRVNSGVGSDHAGGNHHLVMGGSVRGRQTYGAFPTLALSGPDDTDRDGRWIPTLSIEQYAGTLATWFGVAPADLDYIFPNRSRFNTAPVGFMT